MKASGLEHPQGQLDSSFFGVASGNLLAHVFLKDFVSAYKVGKKSTNWRIQIFECFELKRHFLFLLCIESLTTKKKGKLLDEPCKYTVSPNSLKSA